MAQVRIDVPLEGGVEGDCGPLPPDTMKGAEGDEIAA